MFGYYSLISTTYHGTRLEGRKKKKRRKESQFLFTICFKYIYIYIYIYIYLEHYEKTQDFHFQFSKKKTKKVNIPTIFLRLRFYRTPVLDICFKIITNTFFYATFHLLAF